MRTTHSIQFYCRQSRANKDGYAPVEMSITINGKRAFINLPRKEIPENFTRLVNSKKTNDLKAYLEATRVRISEIETDMMIHRIPLTLPKLREYIQTGGVKTYDTEALFKDFLGYISSTNVTAKTVRKYQIVMDLWRKCDGVTDDFVTATNLDARRFYAFLQSTYQQSTVSGMATKMKTIFQYAVDKGIIKTNPFSGIKIAKGEKEVEFLTDEELKKIAKTPMPTPCYERVKDLFLFQAGTGLAYCDMAELTPEDVRQEGDTYYISKRRLKTGVNYTTILLPQAVTIWKKYEGNLPVITNQRYNIYLKAVQGICGITKSLHTHMARHSFACLALKPVRIEVVSKCLGHTNLRQTQHYAKLVEKTQIEELQKLLA